MESNLTCKPLELVVDGMVLHRKDFRGVSPAMKALKVRGRSMIVWLTE